MDSMRYQQGNNMGNRRMQGSSCGTGQSGMQGGNSGYGRPGMSMPRPERPDPDDFPIGMGYVPMQKWRDLYPMEKGFMEGTIFMELNRIFCGKRGNRA